MIADLVKAFQALIAGVIRALEFFTDKGLEMVSAILKNLTRAVYKIAVPLVEEVGDLIEPVVKAFVAAVQQFGPGIAENIRAPFAEITQASFLASSNGLESKGESTPTNALEIAGNAMADAFGFGMASAGVTAAFEAAFPEKLNTLNGLGPMFSQMAGFAEVAKAVREPLYDAAFGQSLKYYYRSKFKPELPSERDAVLWHSRGLLSDDQLRTIFGYSGLKTEYEPAFVASAYRAVSPFILERAASTGALSDADLRDALTFNGLRPVDIERMIAALGDVAVDPYRKQALAAFESAAVRGLYSGPDIDTELDALNVAAPARPYLKKAIAYKRLETLADLYRKSISEAYKFGQVTDAQYIPLLEQAGLNQADAGAHYEIDSIALRGKEAAANARAAAKLDAERTRAAVQAATEQYRDGVIDAAGLALALAAAGLDPQIAASLIEPAAARPAAAVVYVFGLTLSRDKAILLREKVAAVEEQVVKKLTDATFALETLASFGIPDPNAEALVAKWVAQAYKQVLPP